MNRKTIPFQFILRSFWTMIPEPIPEKGQKQSRNWNCDSFGINTALIDETPYPKSGHNFENFPFLILLLPPESRNAFSHLFSIMLRALNKGSFPLGFSQPFISSLFSDAHLQTVGRVQGGVQDRVPLPLPRLRHLLLLQGA